MMRTSNWIMLWVCCFPAGIYAAAATPGDAMLERYFQAETARLSQRCLVEIKTAADWRRLAPEYRQQLAEMLGLWPMPPKTDLKVVITGKVDHPDFTVEKLHFQSRPGLYVTANLYVPRNLRAPVPAILYVCGHSQVKKDGVAYGAKAAYQHHGAWFARNGYVCLIPDTLVNGEIEGTHHGLYRFNRWWWASRGYTPAGVEAWNGIRCIDYLQSRPEVDPRRIGMTGRSGGGAYTWWTAALDERVAVAVPVAGITDMRNQVVDGVIEGHCDCMFMVNTYRWDFAQVAALISPRPMLLSNTDKDTIFPLDGVVRLHSQVRDIYQLQDAGAKLGLLITEGPHKDTQDLQVPAFRWFNRFLKQEEGPLKDAAAEKLFEPEQLKVFAGRELPADQINTRIDESFVPAASLPPLPTSAQAWSGRRDEWMAQLRGKTFGGWPSAAPAPELRPLFTAKGEGIEFSGHEFVSQEGVRLRFYLTRIADQKPITRVVIRVLDQAAWEQWLAARKVAFAQQIAEELQVAPTTRPAQYADELLKLPAGEGVATIWFAPRGIGMTAWNADQRKQTHVLRRFTLLGQTLDGMRVWDTRRVIEVSRQLLGKDVPVRIQARAQLAAVALYAALFEPPVAGLELTALPASHQDGPAMLNILKTLDLPVAVALAAERCQVRLLDAQGDQWSYPQAVASVLGWPADRVQVVPAKP